MHCTSRPSPSLLETTHTQSTASPPRHTRHSGIHLPSAVAGSAAGIQVSAVRHGEAALHPARQLFSCRNIALIDTTIFVGSFLLIKALHSVVERCLKEAGVPVSTAALSGPFHKNLPRTARNHRSHDQPLSSHPALAGATGGLDSCYAL